MLHEAVGKHIQKQLGKHICQLHMCTVQTTVLSSTINLLSVTQKTNKFKPANSTVPYIALLLLAKAEDVETNPVPRIDVFSVWRYFLRLSLWCL